MVKRDASVPLVVTWLFERFLLAAVDQECTPLDVATGAVR